MIELPLFGRLCAALIITALTHEFTPTHSGTHATHTHTHALTHSTAYIGILIPPPYQYPAQPAAPVTSRPAHRQPPALGRHSGHHSCRLSTVDTQHTPHTPCSPAPRCKTLQNPPIPANSFISSVSQNGDPPAVLRPATCNPQSTEIRTEYRNTASCSAAVPSNCSYPETSCTRTRGAPLKSRRRHAAWPSSQPAKTRTKDQGYTEVASYYPIPIPILPAALQANRYLDGN